MAQNNPLLSPPFYLIPGIDPNSPISAQMDQIDQLNTLLLRDIDANFAKFHQVITSKVLPEIKRFAIASEPIREAAGFWRTFFEAAASTKLPDSDASHLAPTSTEESTYDDETVTFRPEGSEAGSFFHLQDGGLVSSTPLHGRAAVYDDSDSLESPYERTERRLGQSFHISSEAPSSSMPTPSLPSGYDLPDLNSGTSLGEISLPQPRPSSATPKPVKKNTTHSSVNIFDPSNSQFSGIVDMRSTPLNAKFKKLGVPKAKPPKLSMADLENLSDDDVQVPFSPPRTMTFNLPPRAAAIQAAGRTPVKQIQSDGNQAKAILDGLMEEMEEEEASPKLDTPQELRRYSVMPGELGRDASRQLFTNIPEEDTFRPGPSRHSMANTSFGSDHDVPDKVIYDDSFESNDSFDSPAPAAAQYADDSYMSDMSPLGQRQGATALFGRPEGQQPGEFNVMGSGEMVTIHGGRLEDAWSEVTPTRR